MVSKSSCVRWLQKRTNLEKTLLSLSTLSLLTLFLIILVGVAYHGKTSNSSQSGGDICWTKDCISTAGEMLSSMNPDSSSCSNFYDFACGRYKPLLSVQKRNRNFVDTLLKRMLQSKEKLPINEFEDLRKFYDTCVKFGSQRVDKVATRKDLMKLMREVGIGDWPIIEPMYNLTEFSIHRTLAKLILLDIPVAFRIDIVPDKQTGIYLMKIGPGGPREKGRSPDVIRSDVHLRSSILTPVLMLAESTANTNTDVTDILSVDSQLSASEQVRNVSCDTILLPPNEVDSELQRLVYNVDWTIVLSEIRKETKLSKPFAVQLFCREEIRDYMVHLNSLIDRSAANYLGWRFFSTVVDHVIPTSDTQGQDKELSRFRVCLYLLKKIASPLLSEAFIRKMINETLLAEAEKLSRVIVKNTDQMISRTEWLSPSQKSIMKEKVFQFIKKLPFKSNKIDAKTMIDIPLVNMSNFTTAIVLHQKQTVIQRFQKLTYEMDTDNEINKYFSIPDDFSAVLPPFLRSNIPNKWINYGGFGVFIARRMSKFLFSADESTFHDNASLWDTWIHSKNYRKCINENESMSLHSKARNNLFRSRFLDQSSVEIAFESAKSTSEVSSLPGLEINLETSFFLSYAQTLCETASPNMSNLRERLDFAISTFREAFGCQPSPTYCRIWM